MSTTTESHRPDAASPEVPRRERAPRGDGRRSTFPLFVALSAVSLAAYLAVSPAVRGFLERAAVLLDTLVRVVS